MLDHPLLPLPHPHQLDHPLPPHEGVDELITTVFTQGVDAEDTHHEVTISAAVFVPVETYA